MAISQPSHLQLVGFLKEFQTLLIFIAFLNVQLFFWFDHGLSCFVAHARAAGRLVRSFEIILPWQIMYS
jgi:hypothetical protein